MRGIEAGDGLSMPSSLEAVQAALPPDTAVLAYFVGDRRSHAWLLTRNDLRHAALPGKRALDDIVNSFVELQRAGERTSSHAPIAAVAGNLLKGVNARRLLVLPDVGHDSLVDHLPILEAALAEFYRSTERAARKRAPEVAAAEVPT